MTSADWTLEDQPGSVVAHEPGAFLPVVVKCSLVRGADRIETRVACRYDEVRPDPTPEPTCPAPVRGTAYENAMAEYARAYYAWGG